MSVTCTKDILTVNGVKYEIPERVKSSDSNVLTVIGGKITINGYEFNPKTGEFTRDYSFWWIMLMVISSAIASFIILNP